MFADPRARRARDIAIALILALAGAAWIQWWDLVVPAPGAAPYQAVFLANGQTFFGRYHDRIGPYAKLEAPYYIQQSQTESGQAAEPLLVRRGNELHQPAERVLIPKTSIIFVEDLRAASPIGRFMEREARR